MPSHYQRIVTDPSKIKWFFHPNSPGYARMAADLGGV